MSAMSITTILPANASDGRCQRDSLNFFSQRCLFIAEACKPASNRTFIASYIIMTVNAIARAKTSELIQCFNAIAVVNDTTTDEWTDGIHQLPKALRISTFPVVNFTEIPLIKTVTKNVIAGISSKLS